MARRKTLSDVDKISESYEILQPEKRAMLAALSMNGNITTSAETAGIARQTHYDWMKDDTRYSDAVSAAMNAAGDRLEAEARRRAVEGTLKPIYQGGKKVGTVKEFSDTLLIFLMKGANPDKYKERVATEHSGSVKVVSRPDLSKLTDEELALLDSITSKTAQ